MAFSVLADIGGTNTRVALARGREVLTETIRRYPNAEYRARGQDIARILADYLTDNGTAVEGVCVAAAGPVQDGVATMTNLDWVMDAAKLRAATGAERVAILNDLQAQGHALGHIPEDHLRTLVPGPSRPGAPMLVVGLGTGVNAAPVHGQGAARVVPPSECGHVNMPVRNEQDFRLLRFMEARLEARGEAPHCGVEEVLAGRGLVNLNAFAASEFGMTQERTSAEVLAAMEAADPVALLAGEIYTRILGQVLADLALIHLPWGGIYLIGGMSRAMLPWFGRFGLKTGFREPRRVDLLTSSFSITLVEDDYAALTGCAAWLDVSTSG